jgi:hypothetical protein
MGIFESSKAVVHSKDWLGENNITTDSKPSAFFMAREQKFGILIASADAESVFLPPSHVARFGFRNKQTSLLCTEVVIRVHFPSISNSAEIPPEHYQLRSLWLTMPKSLTRRIS